MKMLRAMLAPALAGAMGLWGAAQAAEVSATATYAITLGGTNIFNVKPTAQDPNETDNGFKYESVQFGLSGAAWFARLSHRF